MFLTPPSPNKTKFFANKYSHERSPPSYSRSTNHPHQLPSLHTNYLPALQPSAASSMTTHHRGLERNLPPPPTTSLPDPLRAPASRQSEYEHPHAHNVLPPPRTSPHSQAYDRSEYRERQEYRERPDYRPSSSEARSSYDSYAKAEEFRYHQELERTKQEDLRVRAEEAKLAQRKMEQEIMREAIRYSTHPNLVPLIFVGLGAANSSGFETAQQYINTIQQIQTHFGNQMPPGLYSSVGSPDLRRDYRPSPAGPMQYGALSQQQVGGLSSQAGSSMPGTGVYPSPAAYQTPQSAPQSGHLRQIPANQPSAFSGRLPPVAAKAASSQLPRLSTNEAQVSAGVSGSHGQSIATGQIPGQSERTSPSPSISFHHWQPPATQASAGKEPVKTSPKHNVLLAQSSESMPSPRKRKATGPHEPAPRPSGIQRAPSPTFSTTSTSSRRPGRRRESLESGPAEKHYESRAASREPHLVAKEEQIEPKSSRLASSEPARPSTQPTSAEVSSRADT